MDHLVFAVPDLAEGIELVERQTGVRPRFGGRHPGRSTHDALAARTTRCCRWADGNISKSLPSMRRRAQRRRP